jgi:hypothetical protein
MELPSDFIKQMILRVLQAPPFLRQAVLQQGLRVLMRWSLFVISSLPSKLEGEDGLRNKNLKMIQVPNMARVNILLTHTNYRMILGSPTNRTSTFFYTSLIRADQAFTPVFSTIPRLLES